MSDDIVPLRVNITGQAAAALEVASHLTGDSRTDVLSRALIAYEMLVKAGRHEGSYRISADVAGAPLYLVVCRTKPKRRWFPW